MILCLDSGNSRLKWGMHDGRSWLEQGAVAQGDAGGLSASLARLPQPDRILMANVAGEAVRQDIAQSLAHWGVPLEIVRSAPAVAGVTNLYKNPTQLGVDRWCALVAAWHMVRGPAVVVMAGTATTIDTLDEQGAFIGGLILPGMALMRDALAGGTAGLRAADGDYQPWPRCTADAMVSGVLDAQAGAIERAFHRLPQAEKTCIISGGNASGISACLEIPHRVAHNLPLDGIVHIARDS